MITIFEISKNTYKELIRSRILYLLLFFTIFLIATMTAIGQLSFKEQMSLTLSLGLPCIHISLSLLTMFVGSTLVYNEIEKLTILTLLTRPVFRFEFLIGKYLGFLKIIFLVVFSLYVIFAINLKLMNFEVYYLKLCITFFAFFLEMMVLLSVVLLFSTFSGSFLTCLFSFSFFLIGHWVHNVSFLSVHSTSNLIKSMSTGLYWLFPDLEIMNFRQIDSLSLALDSLLKKALPLSVLWCSLFLMLASLIFTRRDFV